MVVLLFFRLREFLFGGARDPEVVRLTNAETIAGQHAQKAGGGGRWEATESLASSTPGSMILLSSMRCHQPHVPTGLFFYLRPPPPHQPMMTTSQYISRPQAGQRKTHNMIPKKTRVCFLRTLASAATTYFRYQPTTRRPADRRMVPSTTSGLLGCPIDEYPSVCMGTPFQRRYLGWGLSPATCDLPP